MYEKVYAHRKFTFLLFHNYKSKFFHKQLTARSLMESFKVLPSPWEIKNRKNIDSVNVEHSYFSVHRLLPLAPLITEVPLGDTKLIV